MANAHNDPGPDGLKMFNIGYLAGIAGILLAWNSAILIKVTVSNEYIGYVAICLKKTLDSKPFYPALIAFVVVSLCLTFSLIISYRTYEYLSKLQDSHLCNLPGKNALTYIDTLILFSIVSGSCLVKLVCNFIRIFDISLFEKMNRINCTLSVIVDDIGVGLIFPIYIILKTRRYLPKLWDDSREIIAGNNDFFSTSPAAVAPTHLEHQPTNKRLVESIM